MKHAITKKSVLLKNGYVILTSFLLIGLTEFLTGQGGPIKPTENFIGTKEIMLLWDKFDLQADKKRIWFQQFGVKPDYEAIEETNERLQQGPIGDIFAGTTGSRYLGMAEGDFNNDGIQTVVIAQQLYDRVEISEIIDDGAGNLTIKPLHRTRDDLFHVKSNNNRGRFMIRTGDVDGDNIDEIVVAYMEDFNYEIVIEIFERDKFSSSAAIKVDVLSSLSKFETFAIATDDFDHDGDHEIALVHRSNEDHAIYLNLLNALATDSNITNKIEKASSALIDGSFASNSPVTVSIATGFLNNDTIKDLVVAYGTHSPCSNCTDTWIQPVEVTDDPQTSEFNPLEKLVVQPSHRTELRLSGDQLVSLNLITADLNLDGKYEVVVGANPNRVLSSADTAFVLIPVQTFGGYNDEYGFAVDFMRAADVTGDFRNEIIMVSNFFSTDDNYDQYLNLEIFRFKDDLTAERIVYKSDLHKMKTQGNIKERRHYGIAVGDFNGDNFKIGQGKKYIVSDIVQPLVVLNAPPTHFDVIDGVTYDLVSCYTGDWRRTCNFWAEYTESTSTDSSISTTLHSDWGISSEISGSGSYLGLGVSAYMKGTYGEKFSNTSASQKIVNITSSVRAWGDDRIYATISDYELWEYPIYMKNQKKRGNLIAVVPISTEDTWFSAKERTAYDYMPTHESGNILSYSRWGDSLAMRGEPIADLSTYEVSNQNTSAFTFETSEIFSNEQTSQYDIGIEVGGSIGGWGVEVSGTAHYNFGEIQTHSIQIQKDISLTGNIGYFDGAVGEAGYSVKPYLYQSKNGALVVDYKVEPILPVGSGDTDTWWSQHYGQHPDPAFVLPWRLDPEKALALQSEDKRTLTKSISLSKKKLIPGDTVTLRANVHNFSVKYCTDPVKARFYLGEPENGVLIAAIDGTTDFHTESGISEQSYKAISFRWVVPENIGEFNRLYGVLDQDNSITEIHESNNMGWIILANDGGIATSSNEKAITRVEPENQVRIWPNPASDRVQMEIPAHLKDAIIEIISINGKVLQRIDTSGNISSENVITLELTSFPKGIYFLNISNKIERESIRLIKT